MQDDQKPVVPVDPNAQTPVTPPVTEQPATDTGVPAGQVPPAPVEPTEAPTTEVPPTSPTTPPQA